ncbi:MAG: glutamate synthase [Geobacteraceae bacterium GWC2_58_44]|nr:MAG: glutamate synthase [Geobacteraceae bacterium GWC2_58_44]HBG04879.1 glutamate synthase [Geobacter sp.]
MKSRTENSFDQARALLRSRAQFRPEGEWLREDMEAEGGCGVTGFACSIPVGGRHIYEPSKQMRNRGNGKGGGIAACGLVAEDLGVAPEILKEDYILQIALLDPSVRGEVERKYVEPYFEIDHGGIIPTVDDYREIPLLEIRPPDVARYFVRPKPQALRKFAADQGLQALGARDLADEFVSQNSLRLNTEYYASLGEKRAFVMSHAKNLIILKIVGFAEAAVQYYRMSDTRAHVWIAHQRFPTKGRVWHPGGAHPFIGLNEALVHNGDFANYHSVCEYLAQRNIFPQFLTDTEVSIQLFDLWNRVYKYPLEYIIEALAPTTEFDFDKLPAEKRRIYRQIQAMHMHGSPDGPWFFIIARSLVESGAFQLIGITDTAMLRPQVFALQEGEVSIGLICSEKQAIDATLASLASEDKRFTPIADKYWNARGGSHTDGGSFVFTVSPADGAKDGGAGKYAMTIADKFGKPVTIAKQQAHCDLSAALVRPADVDKEMELIARAVREQAPRLLSDHLKSVMAGVDYDRLRWFSARIAEATKLEAPAVGIEALTLLIDHHYQVGRKKRSSVLTIFRGALEEIFTAQPLCDEPGEGSYRRVTWESRDRLRAPAGAEKTLLINARGFKPEGADCDATLAVRAYRLGWRHLVHYNSRGTRFHAAGFGPKTDGLRVDCYDNAGDYLASGMDGLEAYMHGNAQDQLGQITKRGKLVIYGDVGQTFLYGAKGGECYVMGNAAGRPMINAVGRPRVIINGTALDFLAESFMAGNPHEGGGFAIVNGMKHDEEGNLVALDSPYPGSNLLSLASGGAIFIRDPHKKLADEQLNGGVYRRLTKTDWKLILPYLRENERLFDIQIERDLLTVDKVVCLPGEVYRKVIPTKDAEIETDMEGMDECNA